MYRKKLNIDVFRESKSATKLLISKKQIKWHLLAWTLIIVYSLTKGSFTDAWISEIIGRSLFYLNYMFVYYSLSLYIFPKYCENKPIVLFLGILFTLLLFWFFCFLIRIVILPSLGEYHRSELYDFLGTTLYYFVITGSAAIASFYFGYGLYNLKLQAEKEKLLLVKEINFFKNQFNSQSTFNFLDYCYGKVRPHSVETARSITLFSDMLRYTLETKAEEMVPLQKEIVYIESFVAMQKLLSTKVYVMFSYKGEMENNALLPRILITFVENAFKHGLFNNPEDPIVIDLRVEDKKLFFTTRNKVNQNKKTRSSHTGLENVKQILDLYYTNQYQLKMEETKGFFNVELNMELN